MARDWDVVRRVGENHLRESSPKQLLERFESSGVAAQQTMPAQNPQVAPLAHRRRRFIDCRKLVEGFIRRAGFADQQIDFGGLETGDGQIEIEVELRQILQFECEELAVPTSVLGQFVVGRTYARFSVSLMRSSRIVGTLSMPRSFTALTPAVSRYHSAFGIDQNRIGETKLADAVSDLPNLPRRVGSRVPRIELERRQRNKLHAFVGQPVCQWTPSVIAPGRPDQADDGHIGPTSDSQRGLSAPSARTRTPSAAIRAAVNETVEGSVLWGA